MRKLLTVLTVLTVALTAGACAGDAIAPDNDDSRATLDAMAELAYGATSVGDPGDRFMERLAKLPPELALSAAQAAQIDALIAAFLTATAADRAALAAIMEQAIAAREAGATREEVRAIFATGAELRTRLRDAERALRADVLAVLTPAQRAALTSRTSDARPCSTLTEAQRNEISALRAAFEQTFATETALVRSARERALAAREAGAPRAEIRAIIAEARVAMQRLVAARVTLREAVAAVLTPEQHAAGCFRQLH